MGQIWDILRPVHFGLFKKSQICPIWGQSDPILMPTLKSMEAVVRGLDLVILV